MKAYRFRLDSVLRVRRLQERAATQQLAVAVRDAAPRPGRVGPGAPFARRHGRTRRPAHDRSVRSGPTRSRPGCPRRRAERAEAVEAAAEAARQANAGVGERPAADGNARETRRAPVALWRAEFDRSEAAELDDLTTRRTGREGGAAMTISPVSLADIEQTMARTAAVVRRSRSRFGGRRPRSRRRRVRERLCDQPGPGDRQWGRPTICSPMPSPPTPTLRRTTSLPRSVSSLASSDAVLRSARRRARRVSASSGSEADLLALLVAALGDLTASSGSTGAIGAERGDRRRAPGRAAATGGVTGSDVVAEARAIRRDARTCGVGRAPRDSTAPAWSSTCTASSGSPCPGPARSRPRSVRRSPACPPRNPAICSSSPVRTARRLAGPRRDLRGQRADDRRAPHGHDGAGPSGAGRARSLPSGRVLPGGNAATTRPSSPAPTAGGPTQMGNVAVPAAYAGTIQQAASSNGIPASFWRRSSTTRAGSSPNVVSSAGAEGIAQFMPATAAGMGIDPTQSDPVDRRGGSAARQLHPPVRLLLGRTGRRTTPARRRSSATAGSRLMPRPRPMCPQCFPSPVSPGSLHGGGVSAAATAVVTSAEGAGDMPSSVPVGGRGPSQDGAPAVLRGAVALVPRSSRSVRLRPATRAAAEPRRSAPRTSRRPRRRCVRRRLATRPQVLLGRGRNGGVVRSNGPAGTLGVLSGQRRFRLPGRRTRAPCPVPPQRRPRASPSRWTRGVACLASTRLIPDSLCAGAAGIVDHGGTVNDAGTVSHGCGIDRVRRVGESGRPHRSSGQ